MMTLCGIDSPREFEGIVDTIRIASLADALIHLSGSDRAFVRLALSTNDVGKWVCRSLVIDVLPERWFVSHDETLLTPWRADRDWFESSSAYFFCGLLHSRTVWEWLAHPDRCHLAGFDDGPGFAARRVSFTIQDVHDNVASSRLESFSRHGPKPILYPCTLYVFTREQAVDFNARG